MEIFMVYKNYYETRDEEEDEGISEASESLFP